MTITVHEAKTHLSKYLAEVENGLEILIARGKKPVARLVPLHEKPVSRRPNVGEMIDKPFHIPASAFAPLSKKELADWGL
jgi:prevent-host-death family protein